MPNISLDDYSTLEKISMDYAYDIFVTMKSQYLQRNQESYNKYMYALQLRAEAAVQIGILDFEFDFLADEIIGLDSV